MSKSQFPKILIVGQAFTLNKGGGITMANLFKGSYNDANNRYRDYTPEY